MTDTEPFFEWEEFVSKTYAGIVGEADPDEGIPRQEAFDLALPIILNAVEAGDVKPDLTDVVKRALLHADSNHGKRADRLIEMTAAGQLLIDFEDDLSSVVTLGEGRRKLWRYCNEEDVISMDEIRHKNVVHQQNSYNRWREAFEPVRRVLRSFATIESAIEHDAFATFRTAS